VLLFAIGKEGGRKHISRLAFSNSGLRPPFS